MPKRWRHFKKERAPSKPHSCDWVIWCLGYWLYGSFLSSHGMKYILVVVDYVCKWVEAITLANNEVKSVIAFLKRIYSLVLAPQGKLLVIGAPTYATNCSSDYWRNMGFAIMWTLLTILKLVGKLKCQIGRSNRYRQKQWTLVERIGQGGWWCSLGLWDSV